MSIKEGSITLTNTLQGAKTYTSTESNTDMDATGLNAVIDGENGVEVSVSESKLMIGLTE